MQALSINWLTSGHLSKRNRKKSFNSSQPGLKDLSPMSLPPMTQVREEGHKHSWQVPQSGSSISSIGVKILFCGLPKWHRDGHGLPAFTMHLPGFFIHKQSPHPCLLFLPSLPLGPAHCSEGVL